MAKLGRNDPCDCGSGKKYKRCCLPVDEGAADVERLRGEVEDLRRQVAAATAERDRLREELALLREAQGADDEECLCPECLAEDELERMSNRATELARAKRFDEAEAICRDLAERFPDRIDGIERLGQVYEARGEAKAAAREYRKAAERVLVTEDLADGAREWFLEQAERLDPGGTV